MDEVQVQQVQVVAETRERQANIPVGLVPTPTREYRIHRKYQKATAEPGQPVPMAPTPTPTALAAAPTPIPTPPLPAGPRVLMWKQDPSVADIGIRRSFLPGFVLTGPKDARLIVQGLSPVSANAFGDFIQAPGTDAFDAVHTFAVVRQTLTMYQRALTSTGNPVPWQWNSATNIDALSVFPHGLPNTMNAFYSRGAKALKFGDFLPPATPASPSPARVFTCQSLDIVSHETGHAVLDGLQPGWLLIGNPPQTGGLHESFGDLTAIFLTLSQLDQAEAIVSQTKANLHDKTFLADLAEQFGLALGRPNGLRNADNNLKLSEVGTEVHAISQVFTGGIYDVLADIFAFERNPLKKDDAVVLHDVGQYICSLVLRALMAAPTSAATFADVVNQMLSIVTADGKPAQYRNFIRNQFTLREVVVAPPIAIAGELVEGIELAPDIEDDPEAIQDRRTCCGTMQLDEYIGVEDLLQAELAEFKKFLGNGWLHENGRSGLSGNGKKNPAGTKP